MKKSFSSFPILLLFIILILSACTTVSLDTPPTDSKPSASSYTVAFDGQGATTAPSPAFKTVTSPATTVDALPTPPLKTGYLFGSWFTQTNGGGTEFTAATAVNANITVYANWTNYSYNVLFDDQGATVAVNPTNKTVASPATTVVTLPTAPAKTGFSFAGWYTATNGGGTAFLAGTTVTSNMKVYAYWSVNPVYTVTYNSDGGSAVGSQSVTLPATTVGTLPSAPTKSGYTFSGWFTALNGGGTSFTASTTVNADITVYAYWIPNTYTVIFDSQGATVAANPASKTVTTPATTVVTLPTAPAKTGYTFGGWFTAPNGAGSSFTAGTTVNADITVYAKWTADTYTVTYDSQGATVAANPASMTVTTPATTVGTLPTAPTKTGGFVFGGWFTQTNGGGTQFIGSTVVTADITVYAKWVSSTATGPTFGIFSETVSNIVIFDADTKIEIWNGMTMTDDTSTYGDGTKSWKLTGTAADGGWMGVGARVDPVNDYRNLSVFSAGSYKFMFKGQKGFKLGLKTGSGTEAWLLPGQLMDYGMVTNNTWCTVSIPVSDFTGLDLTQMQSYFMFTANASTGYRNGDVFNIDNIYFTTNASASKLNNTFALYSESYPVKVTWDTDGKMDIWSGFSMASNTATSGDGAVSLQITVSSAAWGGLGMRVEPITTYKNLGAYVGGYLTFMYKSTKNFTKIGVEDGNGIQAWVTGATCVSSYGMKTDGTWSKVTIPMSALPGLDWTKIKQYFMFVTDGANHVAGNEYYLDNIYFYK